MLLTYVKVKNPQEKKVITQTTKYEKKKPLVFLLKWKIPPNLTVSFQFWWSQWCGCWVQTWLMGTPIFYSCFFQGGQWMDKDLFLDKFWTNASEIQYALFVAYSLFLDSGRNVKWQSFVVTAHCGLQPEMRSIAYFANQFLPYLHAHFLIADEATRSLDAQVLI